MKLLVFILNKHEYLETVLEAYVEAGVRGATLIDSEGMGRFLTYEIPVFADFQPLMAGNEPNNKTILSLIKDEETLETLKRLIDKVTGGLDKPGVGVMFTVPVDWSSVTPGKAG
jgi:nitrogen regulatory protein PII